MSLSAMDKDLFYALQNINLDQLTGKDVTNVLPFLAKLLISPSFVKHQQLLRLVYPIKKMNDIMQLFSCRNLEPHDTAPPSTTAASFESCYGIEKLRLVATEYIKLQEKARQSTFNPNHNLKLIQSDLFDNPIYVDDVSYCLCTLLMKTTTIPVINILDMSEALLHVKHGPTYIIRLIFNMPDHCQEVCHSLITYGERQDEGVNFNEVSEQRAKTLRMLCLINPAIAFTIRLATLQMCKMPSLTIMITLDHLKDAMDKYLAIEKAGTSDESIDETVDSSVVSVEVKKEMIEANEELEVCYENAVAFISGILLGVDEGTRTWFAQYIKLAQQKRIDQGNHSILSDFRSHLLAHINRLYSSLEDEYTVSVDDKTPQAEDNQPKSSAKQKLNHKELNRRLIRATATLRLFCALRGIGSLKLNPEESEILLRLVTWRSPVVNQTSVNFATTGACTLLVCSTIINNPKDEKRAAEWLKWLIKESNYSDQKYLSCGKSSLSELLSQIAAHFQNNQTTQIAEQICATLGMKLQIKASVAKCKPLFVQEVFNDQVAAENTAEVPVNKDGLVDPIRDFLLLQERISGEFLLSRLETSSSLEFLLHNELHPETMTTVKESERNKIENLIYQLARGFETVENDPGALIKTLGLILALPREEIWPYVNIFVENLSKIIRLKVSDSAEYKKLIHVTTKLWWKFNTVFPRKLWVMTVNSLIDAKLVEYTWDDLALKPEIVLRCDSRVFRCESTLNIVLHILSAFLAASKRFLQDINEKRSRQKDVDLEMLKNNGIVTQTSIAIQILLEKCLPSKDEHDLKEALKKRESSLELNWDERLLLDRFDASVNCICQHLHQVFIADTNLAKLVHFQTYPSELLATTCDKIPSMHICLDFIPELLSQPSIDLSKQVFGIQLTSHLCEKYAITKSLNVAKLCFNVAFTLLQLLSSERRSLFFVPVLPALLKICKVFPILREDADIILTQLNQKTLAHMASTSSRLSLCPSKPFEGLDEMSWCEVKKLMATLSLHEALYLCVEFVRLQMQKTKPILPVQQQQPPPLYNSIFAYGNHVI